ncbi:FAD-dependent oxidoreductase, partial [Psychrobacter proteolyticus]|uniref:FAD-dependent oxidoreductase n=1 Tax=Psychrobacter proteolyticus TaxID=147825 RepID=UPI0031202276
GAGVSGLLTAWSLANRGITVTLLDKSAPLAGAAGNPRALLAPKMTPILHVDEHLHPIGYFYSGRLYSDLNQTAV